MRIASVIMVSCLLASADVFSENRIRDYFEWGEYDSLFIALGNYFSAKLDTVESDSDCIYFSYLGVAWFAKGDIAEAQRQFRSALDCQPALSLDKKYVTPEMTNLFSSVKNDLEQKRAFSVQEESIKEATAVERYEQESRKKQATELNAGFWKNTTVAASAGLVALALGSLAGYEYTKGNTVSVVRCSVAAALCGSVCVVFTIKSVSLHRMLKRFSPG